MNLREIDWINFKRPKGTIYFLDKNVLQLIHTLQEGKELTKSNETKMNVRLKEIDKPENRVSLMLSIIEGRKGRKETPEEKKQAILEEVSILKDFFKQAKTDINFFEKNISSNAEILSGNHIELDEPLYIKYLEEFFELWKSYEENHAIPKTNRNALTDKLIKDAETRGIQIQHPVVVLTLGAVYGKAAALQILKPTEGNPYNAYSDISILTRLGNHKARFSKTHDCDLLTLDKGLLAWFEIFNINEVSLTLNSINGERTSLEININENFLPKKIRERLTNPIQG